MNIPKPKLITKEYYTLTQVQGPLIFVERVGEAAYDELIDVNLPGGETRRGRVLEVDGQLAIAQLFVGTDGIDLYRDGCLYPPASAPEHSAGSPTGDQPGTQATTSSMAFRRRGNLLYAGDPPWPIAGSDLA